MLLTSLSTALLLCLKPAIEVEADLFSSDAALLVFALRGCLCSCLKEGFEAGYIPTEAPKALARARVIRVAGSSSLAVVAFSLFIFACFVEAQYVISN
jgi:hypothetical protein